MNPVDRLHRRWLEEGYDVDGISGPLLHRPFAELGLPMATLNAVVAKEREFGLSFPADFREHLLRGFLSANHYDDDYIITFWAIERLATVRSELKNWPQSFLSNDPNNEYIVFSDLMICC